MYLFKTDISVYNFMPEMIFLNMWKFFWISKDFFCLERRHLKGTFVEGREEGVIEKRTKTNRGRGVLAFVYVRFFKKNAEIFQMKFYSYSPVFPIDYNISVKY